MLRTFGVKFYKEKRPQANRIILCDEHEAVGVVDDDEQGVKDSEDEGMLVVCGWEKDRSHIVTHPTLTSHHTTSHRNCRPFNNKINNIQFLVYLSYDPLLLKCRISNSYLSTSQKISTLKITHSRQHRHRAVGHSAHKIHR